jgi:hypothetical protein
MGKKNLSKIAKNVVAAKPQQEKVVKQTPTITTTPTIIPLTDNERDKKVKETVQNLLSEVNIPEIGNVNKVIGGQNDGVNEGVSEGVNEGINDGVNEESYDGVDQEKIWLEEQVLALNNEVERLTLLLQENSYGYQQQQFEGYDQNMAIQNSIALYNKIQTMYDNFVRGGGVLVIHPKPFLLELETFFPYLKQYRRRLLDE